MYSSYRRWFSSFTWNSFKSTRNRCKNDYCSSIKRVARKTLIKIGANSVEYPERQLAKWTAHHAGSNSIYDDMQLDGGYGVYEVGIPDSFIGKTLLELDLRKKFHINIVGVKINNNIIFILTPD